jgi:hypothetical protein
MGDYWTDRALPVLRALVSPSNDYVRDGFLSLGHGRAEANLGLKLPDNVVEDTTMQLADVGYVELNDITYESGGGAHISGLHASGRGLQVLGEWPRFEALVSPLTFAALLEALAEFATPEEARQMRRAAAVVRRLGGMALRSLAMGTGGQLLRNAMGLP